METDPSTDRLTHDEEPAWLPTPTTVIDVELKKLPAVYVPEVQSLITSDVTTSAVPVHSRMAHLTGTESDALIRHWNLMLRPLMKAQLVLSTIWAMPWRWAVALAWVDLDT